MLSLHNITSIQCYWLICIGMDISDVEAVIVNGPPDTLAQLYQVIVFIIN